ncbi:ABC transporter permease [Azoarcus olearius]|uniref:ABC transporter permease n=1 Tax=Azoarcus sp. (strain BH72) TaxID=418699 RepID=A1K9M0_AZOSB|nr:ABC transporter permease [Azoarcus olearius]ANQ86077.1 ABC transporter permease [Azoarcus olearius]CAL95525.1 ABC transporter permease [Azoarcus olearius]
MTAHTPDSPDAAALARPAAWRRRAANIYRLGIKELWSLRRDPMMLVLIAYTFTIAIYAAATAMPETLHNASIAVVDEDGSPLSARILSAFYPPHFTPPERVSLEAMDAGMDAGRYTFVLDIPPDFQRDVLAGRAPALQLNVDATRMSQAFTGAGYIQQIVLGEVNEFVQRYRSAGTLPVDLVLRARFNPDLTRAWFGSLMEIINQVTMLSIILTGAALIREREHGTIEHLLVMPVTPAEIMLAKVWAMGLVVLVATAISLKTVVEGALQVPIEGSVALFLACVTLHLFATSSMGIFMATLARSMPQFGLLMLLVLLPLQLLSGGSTPRESMPELAQQIMLAAPTTHFVAAAQAILYRGAGLDVVWPQFLAILAIGAVFFGVALARFRKSLSQMA